MFDRTISLGFASAAALWIAGFGLIIYSLFVRMPGLAHVGIGMCCGGAVLLIRSMLCQVVGHLERTAFEIGRDRGRMEASADVPLQRVH